MKTSWVNPWFGDIYHQARGNLWAGNHTERQAGNSAVTPGRSERSIWGCSVSRELETLHQYQMNENGDQKLRGQSEMKGLKARLVFLAKVENIVLIITVAGWSHTSVESVQILYLLLLCPSSDPCECRDPIFSPPSQWLQLAFVSQASCITGKSPGASETSQCSVKVFAAKLMIEAGYPSFTHSFT